MENMNKYSNNTKLAWYTIVFMISMLILISLLTGCAITYDTPPHKCELMQRGEPCLSNHACCKPSTTYHYETYPNYYNWWWLTRPKQTTNYVIVKPNNNWKPSNNNNYKPSNNYSRPSNNYSKPSSNYSRPSSNVISRPSSSPSRGGKINNR